MNTYNINDPDVLKRLYESLVKRDCNLSHSFFSLPTIVCGEQRWNPYSPMNIYQWRDALADEENQ